jgi:serine/threonine protein kinase
MKSLSNRVVATLQADIQLPDLSGTRYSLLRYVACGGMGSVWLAEDTVLKCREALKAVQPTQDSLRVTGQGSVLGTRGYMSPEQAGGDIEVDHRTDIFSLGAILTFMLTGSTPGELPTASGSVPRRLRAICEKAMAADPNARYRSAREMAADITHYLNGEPVSAYPEGLLERSSRVFARHRTAVVLVAVYLIMRVLFILFARR